MRRTVSTRARRRAVAPLAAFLFIIFLAMAAFMVDIGYIISTKAEMQNAADAAALAGASQVMLPQIQGAANQAAAASAAPRARAEAKKSSHKHRGGGRSMDMRDSDVVVGWQFRPGKGPLIPWAPGKPFPNTVQVTVRRDSTANGPLDLFFGKVLGTPTWSGQAVAAVSFQAGRYAVTGFQAAMSGPNPLLLPIGVDVNFVNTFIQTGASPDGAIHDDYTAIRPTSAQRAPTNVTPGSDNIPELSDVYPNRTSPGNFGLVNLNYTNPVNNTPQFSQWILNGPSPADIASFGPNGFQATADSPATIKGGPGWKSALMPDLAAIIGQPRILPVFSSYTGQGSNTYYTIVGFLGVTVVKATGRGSNEDIAFQPMLVIDSTATTGPATTSGSTQFVFPVSPLGLVK